jgi:hypothetical protein
MKNDIQRKRLAVGVSILAVVLLVLGSLSNVVGYQSVQSSGANDSPLFSLRTERATNQQQNILTAQYLGKGNGKLLYFPMRDNKTESLKNFFDLIKKMDDATFQRFLILIKQHLKETISLNEVQLNEINHELVKIKNNKNLLILSLSQGLMTENPLGCYPTEQPFGCFSADTPFPKLCTLAIILFFISIGLLEIIGIILHERPTLLCT